MSIANALQFIRHFEADASLRQKCNLCKSRGELLDFLNENGLAFTPFEFDEVLNSLVVKCQNYEQADYLDSIRVWFSLFQ
jgi:hypothetical protein